MLELNGAVCPAAVADMVIDSAVGGIKFSDRQAETANHDNRLAYCPSQPGQAAGEPDKEVGVKEKINSLCERQRTGKVLRPVGNGVPTVA